MLANKLALFSYGDFSVVSKNVAAVLLLSTGTACTHTHIGGGNASRTPAPILKIKKCVCYDFGVTVDDVICFKTNYSFGVTMDNVICFKTSYSFGVTVASP